MPADGIAFSLLHCSECNFNLISQSKCLQLLSEFLIRNKIRQSITVVFCSTRTSSQTRLITRDCIEDFYAANIWFWWGQIFTYNWCMHECIKEVHGDDLSCIANCATVAVASQGCLPPGVNVVVAAPTHAIRSPIDILMVTTMALVWTVNSTLKFENSIFLPFHMPPPAQCRPHPTFPPPLYRSYFMKQREWNRSTSVNIIMYLGFW